MAAEECAKGRAKRTCRGQCASEADSYTDQRVSPQTGSAEGEPRAAMLPSRSVRRRLTGGRSSSLGTDQEQDVQKPRNKGEVSGLAVAQA